MSGMPRIYNADIIFRVLPDDVKYKPGTILKLVAPSVSKVMIGSFANNFMPQIAQAMSELIPRNAKNTSQEGPC